MKLNIGDWVFHMGVKANGYVEEIDNTKKNPYKIRFYWAKYSEHEALKDRPYNGFNSRWIWSDGKGCYLTPKAERINKISMIGNRSMESLIRAVCCIDKRVPGDHSDIVISYGIGNNRVSNRKLCINRNLVTNKFTQCRVMGTDIAPEVMIVGRVPEGRWVAKPYQSFAGRNIFEVETGQRVNPNTHYLQRFFPKVREFRAHTFLWLNEKAPLINEKHVQHEQLCWNEHQGGEFKSPYQPIINRMKLHRETNDLWKRIQEVSELALRRLHYDFGGVDLGVDADGNVKIFEVNSRMGVKDQALVTYKAAFDALRAININKYTESRWD